MIMDPRRDETGTARTRRLAYERQVLLAYSMSGQRPLSQDEARLRSSYRLAVLVTTFALVVVALIVCHALGVSVAWLLR